MPSETLKHTPIAEHVITTEVERLVMALNSPILADSPLERIRQHDDRRLSSGEMATLQIARMIATNTIDDETLRDLRALIDAHLNMLVDDALHGCGAVHVCVHCGFEIFGENPHLNFAGEDIHAECCIAEECA